MGCGVASLSVSLLIGLLITGCTFSTSQGPIVGPSENGFSYGVIEVNYQLPRGTQNFNLLTDPRVTDAIANRTVAKSSFIEPAELPVDLLRNTVSVPTCFPAETDDFTIQYHLNDQNSVMVHYQVAMLGDLDLNRRVDEVDLAIFLAEWGKSGPFLRADFNCDGTVNTTDYGIFRTVLGNGT